MDTNQTAKTVESLINIRKQATEFLPVGHSFIPFDILLSVFNGYADGDDLTVKSLFTELPYSDMGIRYHFNKLIKSGWIELHNGDIDQRIKRVKPTEKLVQKMSMLSKQLAPLLVGDG